MKEEILSIASDLREGSMTTNEAKDRLLALFGGSSFQDSSAKLSVSSVSNLNGNLTRVEFKTTGNGKVNHHWLIMHGVKTFAGKEPFRIHLGRDVL